MYRKCFFTLIFLIFTLFDAYSQDTNAVNFDKIIKLETAIKSQSIVLQMDYQHTHQLNAVNRFRIGYGVSLVRFRAFNDLAYTAVHTKTENSLGLDTFQVENAKLTAANLFLLLNYQIGPRLDVGFAIDVAGLSWGEVQRGLFASGPGDMSTRGAEAKPVKFNTALAASGAWRSQLSLKYWLYSSFGIHTGLNYWQSAYKITENGALNGEVYTKGQIYWKIGLSYLIGGGQLDEQEK